MVKITFIVAGLTATLSGMVMAANCNHGLDYCGYNLLRKGNYYQDISNSLSSAGQSLTDDNVNNSLFHCGGDDDVPFIKFCGSGRCKDGGSGKDDYCD